MIRVGIFTAGRSASNSSRSPYFQKRKYEGVATPNSLSTPRRPSPRLDSPRIQELQLSESLDRYNTYKMILQAQLCAVQQHAKGDLIMSARVVGHFLLEFHAQPDTFGDSPCASLVRWITPYQSDDRNEHRVIFDVGGLYRDKLIRLCAFIKVSSKRDTYTRFLSPNVQCSILHPRCTLRFLPLIRWKIWSKIQWNPLTKIIGLVGREYAYFAWPFIYIVPHVQSGASP